jgi:DNA-binding helix-hairpin-helix protein with protein kinase domain
METVAFTKDMVRTRQFLLWAVLLQVALLLAGILLYFLGGRPFFSMVELASSLALVLYFLVLVFLRIAYMRQPEVKEKYRLQSEIKRAARQSAAAQVEIAQAPQQCDAIRKGAQKERDEHQVLFDANLSALEEHLCELRKAESDELEGALQRLQNAYIAEGLKAIPFDHNAVPGIGAVLGDKLREHGILTALDIRHEALKRIPGIGDSKATSMVWWRESLESEIKKTQPSELPEDERQAIAAKHAGAIAAQLEEKDRQVNNHEKWLSEIQQREERALAAAVEQETDARRKQEELEQQKAELQEQLKAYSGITFVSLLSTALSSPGANWLKRIGSGLFLLLLAAAGTFNLIILVTALLSRK